LQFSYKLLRCEYEDKSYINLVWERVEAGSSKNGPGVDNTLNSPQGHYACVKFSSDDDFGPFSSSEPRNISSYNGFSANLELKRNLQSCSSTCQLEFYFYMYGKTDDLSIYLSFNHDDETGYGDKVVLERLSNDYGEQWNQKRIALGRIAAPFRIGFDGLRYMIAQTGDDVALDDIKLIDCGYPESSNGNNNTCALGYFKCERSSACIPIDRVCDLVDDCGDKSDEQESACNQFPLEYTKCDFENGLCLWSNENVSTASLPWKVIRAEDNYFSNYAPSRDHTFGLPSGHYAYADLTNNRVVNSSVPSRARLISPVFTQLGSLANPNNSNFNPCAVRMFVLMHGNDIGQLNIYTRLSVGGPEKLLRSRVGEIGNFWERIDATIYQEDVPVNADFQVRISVQV
jgi:hypothetical protein